MNIKKLGMVVGVILLLYALSMNAGAAASKDDKYKPVKEDIKSTDSNKNPAVSPTIGIISPTIGTVNPAVGTMKQRLIVLRLDDIQGYYATKTVIKLTDTALDNGMTMTLGVIPYFYFDEDPVIKNYLIGKSGDPRVEIAQHGYNHNESEHFNQLTEQQASTLIKSGYQKIVSTLGVKPVTFIPPYNEYNTGTLNAVKKLNFKYFSAEKNEDYVYNGIRVVGYTTLTKYSDLDTLVPVNTVINDCKTALNNKKVCVVMIHPQDYVGTDGINIDNAKYKQYVKLLNGLKTLNAKFITFRQLSK